TAVLALPMWVVLQGFLANDRNLYSSGQPVSEKLANLYAPLSGWQLVGIWPVGDFRLPAPTLATALLVGLALLAVAAALWLTLRQGQIAIRSEEHTSELQSLTNLVCRLLLEKKQLYLVLWLKLVKDFLKERCRPALLPFLIRCLIRLDLGAKLPLIQRRILTIVLLLSCLSVI